LPKKVLTEKRAARRAAFRYFSISLLISLAVLGSLTALALRTLGAASPGQSSVPSASADPFYLPQEEDNVNLLLAGSRGDGTAPRFYTLLRLDATGGRIPVVSFPPQTVLSLKGAPVTLAEAWARGGARSAADALSEGLGITVHRYALYTRESLISAIDRVGAMEFSLDYSLDYSDEEGKISLEKGRQLVDGVKFYDLMRCPVYPGGEKTRCVISSRLFAAYANQKLSTVLSSQADFVFEAIVNTVETDLSAADYQARKGALIFLAKLGGSPATDISAEGVWNASGDSYGLTDHSAETLRAVFGGAAPPEPPEE